MAHFQNVNVVYYYVTDWERAKQFYTDVLGWPIAYESDEVGWCEFGREGEAHLAINRWDTERDGPAPTGRGGATATLTVDDVHATDAELRAKGIKCDDILHIPGVVTIGTFYDPEGNRIQFVGSEPG